ncbi:MAG: amidohydrolase family protein, partial [Gemmatimonadaceae bacterium]
MRRIHLFLVLSGSLIAACTAPGSSAKAGDSGPPVTIVNALVVDGSGQPGIRGAVRISGDRIVAVGAQVKAESGDQVVDAHGLVVAPGFIDTHSHADDDLRDDTTALAAVSQGITTIIGGQDGGSPSDLAAFFADVEHHPPPINVAMYIGHNSVRAAVMGDDFKRVATAAEVEKMRVLVRNGMAAGAIGLSSGLEYDPGIYSASDEVLTLAKEAAASGGRYISHIRSEDYAFWSALDEIIRIGREAHLPVQISHTKLAMRGIWNQGDSLVHVLDRARASGVNITADVYPYLFWQSTITVLFPKRNFDDRKAAEFALTQTSSPGGILLSRYAPNAAYEGKTVAEVAKLRGVDSVTALIDLVRDAEAFRAQKRDAGPGGVENIIATSMVEEDVEKIMRWPYTNFCTDGSLTGKHPRSFGSFPRVFGHYVRDRKVMTVEEGVRRASALA